MDVHRSSYRVDVDKRCRDTRDNYCSAHQDVQILCEVGEGDGSNHIASCYLSVV